MQHISPAPMGPFCSESEHDPYALLRFVGGKPDIHFTWKKVGKKRRLIGVPNVASRLLHQRFRSYLRSGIAHLPWIEQKALLRPRSATAFVRKSNPLRNAKMHGKGHFFYIVDIREAYPSIDVERLALLLVYIRKWEVHGDTVSLAVFGWNGTLVQELRSDPLYPAMHAFLKTYFGGLYGKGLAVGGVLSPYLINLYFEVFTDARLRLLCEKYGITYTRYADDLVFSRQKPIIHDIRRELRAAIHNAGVQVNDRKAFLKSREKGTVFVTKIGLLDTCHNSRKGNEKIVFPQRKRRLLHGMILSYLHGQNDWPQKVSGLIAEFLHYYKNVGVKTRTDQKTFALCKQFRAEWAKVGFR